MKENRLFWACLWISIALHSGAFLAMKGFPPLLLQPEPHVEVTYVGAPAFIQDPLAKKEKIEKPIQSAPAEKEATRTTQALKTIPVPIAKPTPLPRPAAPKLSLNIPKELEKDMDYQRYYRLVRDRIRSYAEQNYRGFESSGTVHMAFVVGEKGVLRDIQIFKQDTSASDLLLQVAVRSLKDSAPFPVFPSQLAHKELPFSIYIEFKRD